MPVHAVARQGFSKSPTAYERGRPEYPAEAVRLLRALLETRRGGPLLELGAGTGKFSRALRAEGLAPVALEPLPAMRAELSTRLPGIDLVAGVAESLPFRDGAFEGAFAAQAFHWFDPLRTLPELARVLRPEALLGLIWNVRDERVRWQRELSELMERYRPEGVPAHRERAWRAAFRRVPAFEPLSLRSLRFDQPMDEATLADRVRSVSFVAVLPPDRQEELLRATVELARSAAPRDPATDRVMMRYRTDVYWTRRRPI
jgi:SAM-dependent methyltransferase